MKRTKMSLINAKEVHLFMPKKLKKQIKLICLHRDIEMSEYIRESIIKNNKNYKYLIKHIQ